MLAINANGSEAFPTGSTLQLVEIFPSPAPALLHASVPITTSNAIGTLINLDTRDLDPLSGMPRWMNGTHDLVLRLLPATSSSSPSSISSAGASTTVTGTIASIPVPEGTRKSPVKRIRTDNLNRLAPALLEPNPSATMLDASGALWQHGTVVVTVRSVRYEVLPIPARIRVRLGHALTPGGPREQDLPLSTEGVGTAVFSLTDSSRTGVGGYEHQPSRIAPLTACQGTRPTPAGMSQRDCLRVNDGDPAELLWLGSVPAGWYPILSTSGESRDHFPQNGPPLTAPNRRGYVRLDNAAPGPNLPSPALPATPDNGDWYD